MPIAVAQMANVAPASMSMSSVVARSPPLTNVQAPKKNSTTRR